MFPHIFKGNPYWLIKCINKTYTYSYISIHLHFLFAKFKNLISNAQTFLKSVCLRCLSPPGGGVLWGVIYKEGWGGAEEREPSCGGGNSWTYSSSVSQQESQPATHQALHPGWMRQDAGATWWAISFWVAVFRIEFTEWIVCSKLCTTYFSLKAVSETVGIIS